MTVKPIPDNYHTVTPYLIARDAGNLVEFLTTVMGGAVTERIAGESGQITHAEVKVGNSMIMLGQGSEKYPPMPTMLYVYVDDCDAIYKKAVAFGAAGVMEPANQFYGDRNGTVKDDSGNLWCIATHVEDVSKEELMRRVAQKK